jgi:hypothetical protein
MKLTAMKAMKKAMIAMKFWSLKDMKAVRNKPWNASPMKAMKVRKAMSKKKPWKASPMKAMKLKVMKKAMKLTSMKKAMKLKATKTAMQANKTMKPMKPMKKNEWYLFCYGCDRVSDNEGDGRDWATRSWCGACFAIHAEHM